MSAAVLDRMLEVEEVPEESEASRGDGAEVASLLVRAAAAVSPRSKEVRLIASDNSSSGIVDWSPALAGRAYAVRPAHNGRYLTIALDFDAKLDCADRVAFEAETALLIFESVGIAGVMCASGPAGGRHVFVTIAGDGITASSAKRFVRGLKRLGWRTLDTTSMTNPREGAIRPPFAPHRAGGRSEPLGLSSERAVERLERRNDPNLVMAVINAVHRLAHPRQRAKRTGAVKSPANFANGYASGSEAAAAVAASVANRGGDFTEYMRVLGEVERASQLGDHLADRGADETYFRRTFNNAVAFVSKHPARGGRRPDLEVLSAWPAALDGGRLANRALLPTARAVYGIANDEGRLLIGLSGRSLAVVTGDSPATAARRLTALGDAGMVEVMDEPSWGARRYRLCHPDEWEVPAAETVCPSPTGGVGLQTVSIAGTSYSALADDSDSLIWSPLGLGVSAQSVYRALAIAFDGECARRQVIISHAGIAASHVDLQLARLRDCGLAEKVGRGRWAPLAPDASAVAVRLGIPESTRARTEKYNREGIRDRARKIKLMVDHAVAA